MGDISIKGTGTTRGSSSTLIRRGVCCYSPRGNPNDETIINKRHQDGRDSSLNMKDRRLFIAPRAAEEPKGQEELTNKRVLGTKSNKQETGRKITMRKKAKVMRLGARN